LSEGGVEYNKATGYKGKATNNSIHNLQYTSFNPSSTIPSLTLHISIVKCPRAQ
jgi:hypothetical protein